MSNRFIRRDIQVRSETVTKTLSAKAPPWQPGGLFGFYGRLKPRAPSGESRLMNHHSVVCVENPGAVGNEYHLRSRHNLP
jgi:hypothetical protein